MRRLLTGGLVALSLIAIGCSGGDDAASEATSESSTAPTATASAAPTASDTPVPTPTATSAVVPAPAVSKELASAREAASLAAAQQTVKFEMEIAIEGIPGVPGPMVMTADGASDYASGRSRFSMDMSGLLDMAASSASGPEADQMAAMLGDGMVEMVVDGQTMYMRWPLFSQIMGATTPWISTSVPDQGSVPFATGSSLGDPLSGSMASDPSSFTALLELLDSVSEVGSEDVRGVATTHYSGVLDFGALMAQAGTAVDPQMQLQMQQLGIDSWQLPLGVWLDADGLPRRIVMSMDLGAFDPTAAGGSFTYRFDLFDYGEPVDITVPPASEVTDVGDDLLGQLSY